VNPGRAATCRAWLAPGRGDAELRELWQRGGAGTRLLVAECDLGAVFAGNPMLAIMGA
jgi:hypothetical protein